MFPFQSLRINSALYTNLRRTCSMLGICMWGLALAFRLSPMANQAAKPKWKIPLLTTPMLEPYEWKGKLNLSTPSVMCTWSLHAALWSLAVDGGHDQARIIEKLGRMPAVLVVVMTSKVWCMWVTHRHLACHGGGLWKWPEIARRWKFAFTRSSLFGTK